MKEKYFLAYLGLVISIAIFIYLLISGINFKGLELKSQSSSLMKNMKNKNYSLVCKNFSSDYKQNDNDFRKKQETLSHLLGNIVSYKKCRIIQNTLTQVPGDMIVSYNLVYSKFNKDNIEILWFFSREKGKWKVVGYSYNAKGSVIKLINKIIGSKGVYEREDYNFKQRAKVMAEKEIVKFQKGDFGSIYLDGDKNFKNKGDMQELVNYLTHAKKRYGNLKTICYSKCQFNYNNSEIEADYRAYSSSLKSDIGIKIWIKKEHGLSISGLKFVEQTW